MTTSDSNHPPEKQPTPSEAAEAQTDPGADLTDMFRASPRNDVLPQGAVIDRYRILSVLGEGGFGIVYLAEQLEPVERRVALKVIKPGMDSRQVIARFEAERQALALMSHPNVAKVFDAGKTERGLPYFVMEHVSGSPITEYCDRHRLSIEGRLELFALVCDAIQHAHTKGIIHRDIKPSNVLVEVREAGQPTPKVIDFGIAKAVGRRLTTKTLFTEQGQLIGTPEYMSPEQAEMSAEDIDTRSDVYSLGVLLYELLTGALPFEPEALRRAALAEVHRIIREVDPPRPSTRLSSLGGSASEVASRRRTDPSSLADQLKRELEWIPLKAMRKHRAERYRSAAELADDVRRYIRGEALEAGPESASYRARKFFRRHRTAVTTATMMMAAVVTGLLAMTWGFISADIQRDEAVWQSAVANLIAADAALNDHDLTVALQRLDAVPARHRGWEWGFLADRALRGTIVMDRLGSITSIAFSRDGRHAVAGYENGTVQVFDLVEGRQSEPLELHLVGVTTVAMSPDGAFLAAGSDMMSAGGSGRLVIARTTTGEVVHDVQYPGEVYDVAFSDDGDAVASTWASGALYVWDQSGNVFHRSALGDPVVNVAGADLPVHFGPPDLTATFAPGGRTIVTGSVHGVLSEVNPWSEDRSTRTYESEVTDDLALASLARAPDGLRAIGTQNGLICLSYESDVRPRVLRGHRGPVLDLAFSANGDRLISAGTDGTIRVWSPAAQREVMTFLRHNVAVLDLHLVDDTKLLSAGADGIILSWDLEDLIDRATLPIDNGFRVAYSTDGAELAAARGGDIVSGGVVQWNLRTGVVQNEFDAVSGIRGMAYMADGRLIVGGWIDSAHSVGVMAPGESKFASSGTSEWISAFAVASDRFLAATGTEQGNLWLWGDDGSTPRGLAPIGSTGVHYEEIASLAFLPGSDHVAIGYPAGDVRIWDAVKKSPVRRLESKFELDEFGRTEHSAR